jgi:hypothetical protein
MKCLIASKADSIVIDDAGYLITNHFMRGHASAEKVMQYFHFTMTLVIISGI